ncbi:hypothetical protein BaRGS_00032494, partial [Batillaria attramentaria]
RQWKVNGGKCGICGDPYDTPDPKPNEAGGMYAKGIIVRTYHQADVINVTVKITASHGGYFMFKLCPNNDVTKEATQECLDRHVLQVVNSAHGLPAGDRFYEDTRTMNQQVRLQLPDDVTCTQCVLQWTYYTGNTWACDGDKCCIGCGPQENFVNCVDIAITPTSDERPQQQSSSTTATATPATTTTATTAANSSTSDERPQQRASSANATATPATTTPATTAANSTTTSEPRSGCRAAGAYEGKALVDEWCAFSCGYQKPYCPSSHCVCP